MTETEKKADEAKERVEKELDELNEKIVKLTSFLYGRKLAAAGLSYAMKDCLEEQLGIMQRYASILQRRLAKLLLRRSSKSIKKRCKIAP